MNDGGVRNAPVESRAQGRRRRPDFSPVSNLRAPYLSGE